MKIADFCAQLDTRLAALDDDEKRLQAAVSAVGQAFKVKADEIGILSLDPEREVLCFLWPEKLRSSGVVPLSSGDALASRTVRENKAFLKNSFASVRHSSIFEHFKLEEKGGKSPPIQKIISAPLPGNGHVKGVIQVSRKGEDPAHAGADFSKNDLAVLVEVAKVIARHL